MKKGNAYLGIFKMNFINGLQYRGAALSGMLTQIFWGFMYIAIYTAFFNSGNPPGSFTTEQMSTYVWLGQAFLALRFFSAKPNIFNAITNGNISYHLVRPISIYNQWYTDVAAERFSQAILRSVPMIVIALLLPASFNLALPVSFVAFVFFFISLIIGACVFFSIYMLMIFVAFKTMQPKGALGIVQTVVGLLSGMIVPTPLLPLGLQNVLRYLPFSAITDLAFRIYCGNLAVGEAWYLILIQCGWLVTLILLGKWCFSKVTNKLEIQGG